MEKTVHQDKSLIDGYLPIYIHSLQLESILDFDLYLFNGTTMVLFRAALLPFTENVLAKLSENRITRLYIPVSQRRQYQRYIESHLNQILTDPDLDDFTKASIVYDSAKVLVKDLFNNPTRGENIKRSQELVESTVIYVLDGQNAFHNMLRVMSFDYTIYTHSVNVCSFSLVLAMASGIEKSLELIELGTGALLHDIGKVKIPDSILYKPGPLDPAEMEAIREHPRWGVEIVSETNMIPEASYLPIHQHHERQDGSGYPGNLKADEIHTYSKIVAIADAFDAMTTERVYRGALSSFSALKTMFETKDAYDKNFLEIFTHLMGPVESKITQGRTQTFY